MLTTTLLSILGGLQVISAQSFTVTSFSETTFAVFPSGVATGNSRVTSTIPLACSPGCLPITQTYYACFINTTQPDGSTIPQEFCNDFFCSQGNYTQMLDCVNCIIANGDERPSGYHTNTELTAAPTTNPPPGLPYNPLGLIDEEQANGWLRNVTERCDSIDRAVTGGTSITASPTTTGPYFISFASGETQILPTWTGLTQYPAPVQTLRIPADQLASEAAGSSLSNTGTGNGSPTSTSSAAAGSSSAPNHATLNTRGSTGLSVLGLILAYVVAM